MRLQLPSPVVLAPATFRRAADTLDDAASRIDRAAMRVLNATDDLRALDIVVAPVALTGIRTARRLHDVAAALRPEVG